MLAASQQAHRPRPPDRGRICTRRRRSEGAICRLGGKDQARKEPKRRLHMSSAQVGKEIDPYVAGFRVTSEDGEDECIGPSLDS